jgi:hypothetical protein
VQIVLGDETDRERGVQRLAVLAERG